MPWNYKALCREFNFSNYRMTHIPVIFNSKNRIKMLTLLCSLIVIMKHTLLTAYLHLVDTEQYVCLLLSDNQNWSSFQKTLSKPKMRETEVLQARWIQHHKKLIRSFHSGMLHWCLVRYFCIKKFSTLVLVKTYKT